MLQLPHAEARRRFTPEGVDLARASAVDPQADPWVLLVETYEQLQRWHRKPEEVPDGYDPAVHRYVGRCCS